MRAMPALIGMGYRLYGVSWVNRDRFFADYYLKLFLLCTLNVPHETGKVEKLGIQQM